MKRRSIHASTLIVLAVLLFPAVVPVVARAHQQERVVPRADDNTPLATVLSEVERRYGDFRFTSAPILCR